MNIRTYPYMMKPSCWVLQTVQDLKIWGIHWHRKLKKGQTRHGISSFRSAKEIPLGQLNSPKRMTNHEESSH